MTSTKSTKPRGTAATTLMLIAILGMALALAGCSVTLDMDAIGKSVTTGIASQLGLDIASVDCPKETRQAKAGDVFECTATPKEGGKLTIKVTQKDDKGNIDWELSKAEGILNLQATEAAIVKGIKEQTQADATVSCGGKWKAAKAGDTFDCQATEGANKVPVTVTVKDDAGNISWKLNGGDAPAPAPEGEGQESH